jgi:hypothetical protein
MARSQGQGELAVQRQSLIQGFRGAHLKTEDAIDSELIPLCSFWSLSRKRFAGTRINHVGSLSRKLLMRCAFSVVQLKAFG